MEKIYTDFLIIGAGWSGLVAADLLSDKKQKIIILEKEQEVGGLARTFEFQGFKFDIGGHGLFFKKPENIAYIKTLAGEDKLLAIKRNSKVLFNNRYVDYPVNLSSIFRLNKKDVLKILFSLLRLNKQNQHKNFEEWIKSNYGEHLYNIYFRDYTNKVWGIPCDQISADWASRRIGSNGLLKYFRNIFMDTDNTKEAFPCFYYPRSGIKLLVNSLEQRLENNCHIYKNVKLKKLNNDNGQLRSLVFSIDDKSCEVFFKDIISSIPITEFIPVLPINMSAGIKEAEGGIKYRSLIIVSLVISCKNISNWHWCYIPSKKVVFSRIHEPKLWSKDMGKEGATLLCTEIFCNQGDQYWVMEDPEIAKLVINDLQSIGLLKNKKLVADYCIKRIDYAYPLCYNGAEKCLSVTRNLLDSFKNLHLIGRSGTHSYFDMEECLNNVREKIGAMA